MECLFVIEHNMSFTNPGLQLIYILHLPSFSSALFSLMFFLSLSLSLPLSLSLLSLSVFLSFCCIIGLLEFLCFYVDFPWCSGPAVVPACRASSSKMLTGQEAHSRSLHPNISCSCLTAT